MIDIQQLAIKHKLCPEATKTDVVMGNLFAFTIRHLKTFAEEYNESTLAENAELKNRINLLEDLLTSAACIASRNGKGTHWERFAKQLKVNGIGNITAKTFRILPSDEGYTIRHDDTGAVGWYCKGCKDTGLSHCSDPANCGEMQRTYTMSGITKLLSDNQILELVWNTHKQFAEYIKDKMIETNK